MKIKHQVIPTVNPTNIKQKLLIDLDDILGGQFIYMKISQTTENEFNDFKNSNYMFYLF